MRLTHAGAHAPITSVFHIVPHWRRAAQRYVRRAMIHRASRDKLATALRQYVSGRITNDDLDDIDVDWRDRAAVAVKERSWSLYDDIQAEDCTHSKTLAR
ncbi:MAG: hypothetical protein ACXWKG_10545 [Limisphaerales bacterium]